MRTLHSAISSRLQRVTTTLVLLPPPSIFPNEHKELKEAIIAAASLTPEERKNSEKAISLAMERLGSSEEGRKTLEAEINKQSSGITFETQILRGEVKAISSELRKMASTLENMDRHIDFIGASGEVSGRS